MSHFVLSQCKFVFAVFACYHELFLASYDASSLRELRSMVTLTNNMADTRVNSRSDGKCQNVIKINISNLVY